MTKPMLSIDKSVKKIQHFFWWTGINIKVEEKTRYDKYRCWLMFVLNLVWLNYDVAAAIAWFLEGIAQHQSFTKLTYLAPCITISCLATIKICTMFWNKNTVDMLLDQMRELEIEQKERVEDSETEKIAKTEEKFLNRLIKLLNIFYSSMVICFTGSPMVLMFYKYLMTNKLDLLLPVSASYPFDPFEIRYYPWMYFYQSWTVLICVFYISAADFTFYIICTYLRVQFRLVQYYIERLISSESTRRVFSHTEETKLKLVELIKWHQKLLSLADVLEGVYTKSTLFNFISSSILICLAGFNIVEIDAYVLSFLSFLLMSLLQIFFLCFFGNILMESSMTVGDAAYNSKWYLTDAKLAKYMLVIQTRSQIPCKLTAWGYADVNLNAFMKICGTSWSYFALLQTLYSTPTE